LGRRYHFHAAGVAYAVTTMVLVLGAINGQNNLLFWLFGLGVAGLIVSGVLSGGMLMQLEIEREAPDTAAVGEQVVIRYRVHNRSRVFPAFALTVEEIGSVRAGRFRGTWPGRLSAPQAYAAYVPARGSVVVEARAGALRRGIATLGPVRVGTMFPFGLTKKSKTFYQEGQVLVRPCAAPLRPGIIEGLSGRGELGAVLRRVRGGEEFHSLREYVHGDSPRVVAWRITARLGYAVVREMASRPSRRLWIMLDLRGAEEEACERALAIAAALCVRGYESGLEPGLAVTGGGVLEHARGGRRHLELVLDMLGRLRIGPTLGEGLTLLPPAAYAHDAFVVVQAGEEDGSLPTPAAMRVRVEDASAYSTPGVLDWRAIIDPDARATTPGLWRSAAVRLRAALGGQEAA
jgi:uncharacterized protein (DUF58 family)